MLSGIWRFSAQLNAQHVFVSARSELAALQAFRDLLAYHGHAAVSA